MDLISKLAARLVRQPRRFYDRWRNLVRRDNRYYSDPAKIGTDPTLILVVGAESTATRFITKVLSSHDSICGASSADGHADRFDEVWAALDTGDVEKASSLTPTAEEGKIFVTRRSVPHALKPGSAAGFFEFPPLTDFIEMVKKAGFRPLVFVTVRSPIPNIMSWKNNRSSAGKSLERSIAQYQAVYPYVFDAITATSCPYFILPEEALISDRQLFLNSIFHLLGLSPPENYPEIRQDVNSAYYGEFARGRDSASESRRRF